MHPVIYVSLVNEICDKKNWSDLQARLKKFEGGVVECCSAVVVSVDNQTDVATQIKNWWHAFEQRSLANSLRFSQLLHTDVTDCYGSLYTHSIAWAIHGIDEAKKSKRKKSTLGNQIDFHLQASRYGQTNGICQGSVLMDFIAEIVLGYVDLLINDEISQSTEVQILRYRDDYRIFANSDVLAESVLKVVSDKLRIVGMKLGVAKTFLSENVVQGAIKPDKLAGIELQDLGRTNAKTMQKQLLRLHAFGQRYPNSGALRRLVGEFHSRVFTQKKPPDDIEVQVAIATDIAYTSPLTFPAVAGILSYLIALAPERDKEGLWRKVQDKIRRVPYNGYLEIWLQRVTIPNAVGIPFESTEPICKIVRGEKAELWACDWIGNKKLEEAIEMNSIIIAEVERQPEVVGPKEIELFRQNVYEY
jgi:hypothetical protein